MMYSRTSKGMVNIVKIVVIKKTSDNFVTNLVLLGTTKGDQQTKIWYVKKI